MACARHTVDGYVDTCVISDTFNNHFIDQRNSLCQNLPNWEIKQNAGQIPVGCVRPTIERKEYSVIISLAIKKTLP